MSARNGHKAAAFVYPKWGEIVIRPRGVFALAGEEVVCHRFHPVGRFTRDVRYGQPPREDDFQFIDGTRPHEGEQLPTCAKCGGIAFRPWRQGEHTAIAVHFRGGWRS